MTNDGRPKKPTGVELIKENMKELTEVIGYLDFSFEKAFTIQEKEFMLAYKFHAEEIQKDIDSLKVDPSNTEQAEKEKEKKIKMYQERLEKVRSVALWLDHITQAHTDDSKKRKGKISEIEDNM